MKKLICLLLSMVFIFVFVGCTPDTTSTGTSDGSIVVRTAYSVGMMDENATDICNFLQYCMDKVNAERDDIHFEKMVVFDAGNSVEKQISDLEAVATDKYDIVIVTEIDPQGIVAGVEYCHERGVKVIDLRGGLPTDNLAVHFSAFNEDEMGQYVKEGMRTYLEENPDVVLYTCLAYPAAADVSCFGRMTGIEELAEEMPGRIEILAEGYGNWATEPTQKLAEDWIQAYPQLNYIHCANDEEALGAINAVEAAGLSDKILVTGGNGAIPGTELVVSGKMFLTVAQQKENMCSAMVDICVRLMLGEEIVGADKKYDTSGIDLHKLITKENAQEWLDYLIEVNKEFQF
jgi:ABC-type sugar transport system, periplasmic component